MFLIFRLYLEFYLSCALYIYYSTKRLCIYYDLLLQQRFNLRLLLFYVYYFRTSNRMVSSATNNKFGEW